MRGPYKKKKDDYFFSVVTDHKELKLNCLAVSFRHVQFSIDRNKLLQGKEMGTGITVVQGAGKL